MKKFLLTLSAALACVAMQAEPVVETLTVDNFGFTAATQYKNVTYTSEATGITYAGNMCKANTENGEGMQFRMTKNKEAGLVATRNPKGYQIISVKVTPSTKASTTNQWDVYGSNTAYPGFMALYDNTTAGTALGNGTTEATITPTEKFCYFGFRANKAAIYIQTIEITYELGGAVETREPAGLSFPAASYTVVMGETFTAPVLTKATNAVPVYESSKPAVATVDPATGAVTLVGEGTTTITATTEANDDYLAGSASYTLKVDPAPTYTEVYLASTVADGKYALVCPKGVMKNYTGTSSYGYMYIDETITVENSKFKCNDDYLIDIAKTDNGYTFKTVKGKFLGMDATHSGSFNFYSSPDASGSNCYWDIEFDGTTVKIINKGRAGYVLGYTEYTQKDGSKVWELVTTNKATDPCDLQLFSTVNAESAIGSIVTDADAEAPVEFYNLQGIRVANPEAGNIYIRRQGSKATKVLVK